MIEVVNINGKWFWHLLGFCGRILVQSTEGFDNDRKANDAAKDYRASFFTTAATVDVCGPRHV